MGFSLRTPKMFQTDLSMVDVSLDSGGEEDKVVDKSDEADGDGGGDSVKDRQSKKEKDPLSSDKRFESAQVCLCCSNNCILCFT
jgi:hypothetical protein